MRAYIDIPTHIYLLLTLYIRAVQLYARLADLYAGSFDFGISALEYISIYIALKFYSYSLLALRYNTITYTYIIYCAFVSVIATYKLYLYISVTRDKAQTIYNSILNYKKSAQVA